MSTLVLALYVEGNADERFLPIIVQRAAQNILLREGRTAIDVLQPHVVVPDEPPPDRATAILAVARKTAGYHALIIHADADHPSPERALRERVRPGLDRIEFAHKAGNAVCGTTIPLVPVQMTEAWMMADAEALRAVIGTRLASDQLGLPGRPHAVESDPDPKQTLRDIVHRALADRPRRRRHVDRADLDEPLARQIDLARLETIPAYRQFIEDLRSALQSLHFID
jgi:hypothetical protein